MNTHRRAQEGASWSSPGSPAGPSITAPLPQQQCFSTWLLPALLSCSTPRNTLHSLSMLGFLVLPGYLLGQHLKKNHSVPAHVSWVLYLDPRICASVTFLRGDFFLRHHSSPSVCFLQQLTNLLSYSTNSGEGLFPPHMLAEHQRFILWKGKQKFPKCEAQLKAVQPQCQQED